ncbi:molybdopterin-synthase adenylyltransferase MoeB [Undibacterium cyanobacteriorum]|uniref:Molybdopterin-synthase adenylyltransferase MoeB n=1 Tax=Undibacterium cyanobacteriorum TaxID=3073561 RepID=A0ABY9RIE9_9BURK|nr:molybdopterin-synthase adenylyltransferase MoeB [Undibacterium sp. 20NA77.5]WMW80993.1 molybdopterin-synthase adenylyltransferase MoeB [Undibacterium sp. 20NA77.5]
MNDDQLLRYSRHILLDAIGIEGQQAILSAKVLVVGAGGLGSPLLMYLASSGVGQITVVDHDSVDLTNLQRQIAHTTARVGTAKVESARAAMLALNPNLKIECLAERLDETRLKDLLVSADLVFDCTDNFKTRHAINAACVAARVPLVSGAAISFDGQITVFDFRKDDAPCYACLFSPEQAFEEVQCSTMGVFSPLVGIIGTMQAAEGLKLLMNVGTSLNGRLLMLDAKHMDWSQVRVAKNPHCPVCASVSSS